MPRNSQGIYSLPAGNPVVSGTTITSSWANATMPDLGDEITNSLDRNGRGGMLAPFKIADGTAGAPGMAFSNEPSTGMWRASAGVIGFSTLGVSRLGISNTDIVFALPPTWASDPSTANQLTRKSYVDGLIGANLPLAGGIMTGPILGVIGSVGTPGYAFAGDANTGIYHPVADGVGIATAGVEALRVDAAQNIGLGMVPNAWGSNTRGLQLRSPGSTGSTGSLTSVLSSDEIVLVRNNYYDGTNWRYVASGSPSTQLQLSSDGTFRWHMAPAGTAGNIPTLTNVMTLGATGNLGIGATSPGARLHVAHTGPEIMSLNTTDSNGGYTSFLSSGTPNGYIGSAFHVASGISTDFALRAQNNLIFAHGSTETARIDTSGNFLVGSAAASLSAAGRGLIEINGSGTALYALKIGGTAAGYFYHDGTNILINNILNGNLTFYTNNVARLNIAAAGVITESATGFEVGYKDIPRNTGGFSRGQCYALSAGTTINTATAGQTYSVYNDSAAPVTLTQGGGLTLRLNGTASTGNRTLAARGFATFWFNTASECIISGAVT